LEIRDVIHGAISIRRYELSIIDSRFFQRLRQIKQMGFADHSFPSATHTRYVHSLGALHTATLALKSVLYDASKSKGIPPPLFAQKVRLAQGYDRFEAVLRLAALLHDVGHGPLSHTTECAMPDVKELKLPPAVHAGAGQATHEHYTLKIILDSSLTPHIKAAGQAFGFKPIHVAALIDPDIEVKDDFFLEKIEGVSIDFRPVLHQLVSSELDADRMDYLRRDSLYAGVSYGQFDFDWMTSHLTSYIESGKCYLAFEHRALYTFEDFLISRFHMFLMVYFHHKSVVYDEMLRQFLTSPECEYALPGDVERYGECNDGHLFTHLEASQNEWARRITEKRPFRVLIELHTGIPATKTADQEQQRLLTKLRKELQASETRFLEATSRGELSKYAGRKKDPIFVRYDNHYSAPSFIPVEKCTDLFQRYGEHRSITRLYVSPEDYPKCRMKGRDAPFRYEDDHDPQLDLLS
jgi:HD superfamily phosphohydrolase